MTFSNRKFNVNGSGESMLLATLALVFEQKGLGARAYKFTESGLVLYWGVADGTVALPKAADGLSAAQCLPFVVAWLQGDHAKGVVCEGWDADYDHEGWNIVGWRVFCGDWGHVEQSPYAICAIRPAFLWLGK
jgi:hypothetical protein